MHTNLIGSAAKATRLAAISLDTLGAEADLFVRELTTQQIGDVIIKAETGFTSQEASSTEIPQRKQSDFPTRVKSLRIAIAGASIWPNLETVPSEPELHLKASLTEVSRKFNLNQKQHKAFIRVGGPFLQSLLSSPDQDVDQVIAFLGGGPGTGKSQVIRALQALAESWVSRDALKTVAYQGVAAEAVNGQTIHNLFKWGIEKGSRRKRYSIKDKESFANLKLLIMDEVSTTDASIVGMMDSALRELKNQPNKRFGGVHVLFAGDWFQQLPVAGYPVFVEQPPLPGLPLRKTPVDSRSNDEATTYLLRQRGIDSYRAINEVVMLEENMRHRNDPIWRDILERWRYVDYRKDDIDLVNRRCCSKNWRAQTATAAKAFCPILVTSNALRAEFNKLAVPDYCKNTKQLFHYFPADVSRKRRGKLTRGQRRSFLCIWSDKTKGLPMLMALAIGQPMQCTKHISRALHLANGTIGIVTGFLTGCGDNVCVENSGGYESHYHTKPAHTVPSPGRTAGCQDECWGRALTRRWLHP
ncbi:putative mitochondrial protein [Phytophthora megakarya]|uniref:ATP-dependent DNA helicase n=1 Tax=Phytophthora megakarya TaxID=4795 RepID=A0A225X1P8_9STRA|nr:putative mitochondrial protein [Phytophthora megakarya]